MSVCIHLFYIEMWQRQRIQAVCLERYSEHIQEGYQTVHWSVLWVCRSEVLLLFREREDKVISFFGATMEKLLEQRTV